MTDPFADDGCTFFIDGLGGHDWRACCDAHDAAFLAGGSLTDFVHANLELAGCVAQQSPLVAIVMLLGVMSPIGLAFFLFGPKRRNGDRANERDTE